MPIETAPLLGTHFRPPAKVILAALPVQCPLLVIPEPDNEYDANALRVVVATADIPPSDDAMVADLQACGFDDAELRAEDSWHLGYIARGRAAELVARVNEAIASSDRQLNGVGFYPARLVFDVAGKPQVAMEFAS